MATSVVSTPESSARAAAEKEKSAEVQAKLEKQVFEFLSKPEHTAIAYRAATVVNNLMDVSEGKLDAALHAGFTIQDHYVNESDYRIAALCRAMAMYLKSEARSRVNDMEREVEGWSKEHNTATISRDAIRLEVMKTRPGQRIAEMATIAAELLKTLK